MNNKINRKWMFDTKKTKEQLDAMIGGTLEIKDKDGFLISKAKILGLSFMDPDSYGRMYNLGLFVSDLSNPRAVEFLTYGKYHVYINGESVFWDCSNDPIVYIHDGNKFYGTYVQLPLGFNNSTVYDING